MAEITKSESMKLTASSSLEKSGKNDDTVVTAPPLGNTLTSEQPKECQLSFGKDNNSSFNTKTAEQTTVTAEKPTAILPLHDKAENMKTKPEESEETSKQTPEKPAGHRSRDEMTGKSAFNSDCTEPTSVTETLREIPPGVEVQGATAWSPSEKPDQQGLKMTDLVNRIKGVIYGNCIGDAIGLLTEFMDKEMARKYYGSNKLLSKFNTTRLEYDQKHEDRHRGSWEQGDWTDDSDQMILILRTLLHNNGQFNERDFARKLKDWVENGYPELGDVGGCGLGRTTASVLSHINFLEDPHYAARRVWEGSGRFIAPNGGVMRTSILGTMEFYDLKKVIANTKSACMVTHADPRCVASCVAVTVAIALMLQGNCVMNNGECDVDKISNIAHAHAQEVIEDQEHKAELTKHMFADSLTKLELDDRPKIGYTLKCLGAGFWAFRQKDFRDAIQKVTMEAGDADTNCAVAGALLGCKVGFNKLPESWVTGLANRKWLDDHIERYLALLGMPSDCMRET